MLSIRWCPALELTPPVNCDAIVAPSREFLRGWLGYLWKLTCIVLLALTSPCPFRSQLAPLEMGEEASSSQEAHFGLASEVKVWLCATQTNPRTNLGTQVFTHKGFALKSPRGELLPLGFGKDRTYYRSHFYPGLSRNFYPGKCELNSDSTGHGAQHLLPAVTNLMPQWEPSAKAGSCSTLPSG